MEGCRDGGMEGVMEGWRGGVEGWRGGMEGWSDEGMGEMEGWRGGNYVGCRSLVTRPFWL